MISWDSADQELARLFASDARQEGRSIPRCIEELAAGQAGAPIKSPRDCLSAIHLGLACMGVQIDEDCTGRRLVRQALKYLHDG